MNPRYPVVARRAMHRCEYCHAPELVFNFPFEVEHIIPRSHAGTDDDSNLALACRACNVFKSDRVISPDPETQTEMPMFHPRCDDWMEHFTVDPVAAEIRGLTGVGRATAAALHFNDVTQLAARRAWMRLGLFNS